MDLASRLALPTALGIIDVQVDFCSPEGWRAKNGGDLSYMESTIDNILRLITAGQEAGVHLFYAKQVYDPALLSPGQKQQFERGERTILCDPRTGGDRFYRVNPIPGTDPVYVKTGYNIFDDIHPGSLHRDLQKRPRSIQGLVLVGVDTQICVETAARAGYDRGYSIIVVRDAVASSGKSRHFHDNSLALIEKNFGVVCTTEELIACWAN